MTITATDFARIRSALGSVAEDDITWAINTTEPADPDFFGRGTIFVVCNSGMKAVVARGIYQRCMAALKRGQPLSEVFGHKDKAGAMERIWREREQLFAGCRAATDKLAFCESLPWIGGITKYHLARISGCSNTRNPTFICSGWPIEGLHRAVVVRAVGSADEPASVCGGRRPLAGMRYAHPQFTNWRVHPMTQFRIPRAVLTVPVWI